MKDFISSKKVRLTAGVVGAFVLALLIFHTGIVVGMHRGQWNRHDADRGFRSSFLPGGLALPHGFVQNGHGAVGAITAVTMPTITVQTREGITQTILISTSTMIRTMDSANKTLSVGEQIIVLGEPDTQGRIDAKLIRVLSVATSTP